MTPMRRIFVYLFSLFVCHHIGGGYVVAKRIVPYSLHVGMDVAKLSYGLYRHCQSPLEFYGSMGFYPLLVEWDYGFDYYHLENMPHMGLYFGEYLKFGLGYNFIKPTKHANQFSIGVRYAMSLGGSSIGRWVPSACVDNKMRAVPYEHRAMANWVEWVACAKVSLVSFVYIGSSLRFKVAKRVAMHRPNIRVSYLPGWGSGDSRLSYGYNFYIGFVIPFKKILN